MEKMSRGMAFSKVRSAAGPPGGACRFTLSIISASYAWISSRAATNETSSPAGKESALGIRRYVASVTLHLKYWTYYYSTRNYTQVVHLRRIFPKQFGSKQVFSIFSKKLENQTALCYTCNRGTNHFADSITGFLKFLAEGRGS
jgi:hypothetical protein